MSVRDRLDDVQERTPPLVRRIAGIVMSTYDGWRSDRTIRLGAGLAYYGLFSLASVLTLSVWLVQLFSRRGDTETYLADAIEGLLDVPAPDAAASIAASIDGAAGSQLGLVGLASLLVTGSLFFLALEDALNQIWGVPVQSGIRSSIRRRLTSLLVLLGAAATIVLSVAVQAVSSLAELLLPGSATTATAIGSLLASGLTTVVLTGALALLFRYLPSAVVPWRAAAVAAVATGALIVLGTSLIGWYLRTFGATSLTGAASSVLAVLLWIFYEAQIVLVGAQLCKVLSREYVRLPAAPSSSEPTGGPRRVPPST